MFDKNIFFDLTKISFKEIFDDIEFVWQAFENIHLYIKKIASVFRPTTFQFICHIALAQLYCKKAAGAFSRPSFQEPSST